MPPTAQATIVTGLITSITGTETHGVSYHRGLLEYVAAFQGRLLTADDLEDLPFDSPQVEGGAYKLVFMAEDQQHH